ATPHDPYQEIVVTTPETLFYFNNDSRRLCYTFTVPGRWTLGRQIGALRSENGKAFVGVVFTPERAPDSPALRAAHDLTASYERGLGRPLTEVEISPADELFPGAVRWRAGDRVTMRGIQGTLSPTLFVPFQPGWVAQVTVGGTTDDDAVTRQVLGTLGTTDHPQCYWPLIRRISPDFPR
ncbi:MAG TPA: hypothetical protein VFX28_00765, partial [Methylomirabilota bacterium]|nr:hypothetical protein [Methylomirabilota bacterium]